MNSAPRPGTLATLTARYTGSYANTATAVVTQGSQYVTLSPTYKLTLTFPNAVPEVYDNIVAYATVGGGYSSTTFTTNLKNAVNGSPQLNPSRPASNYFTATTGASTATPLLTTPQAVSTNGTDGSTFAGGQTQADAAQLGNAATLTGMNALSGQIPAGQFCLSGNTDLQNTERRDLVCTARERALGGLVPLRHEHRDRGREQAGVRHQLLRRDDPQGIGRSSPTR